VGTTSHLRAAPALACIALLIAAIPGPARLCAADLALSVDWASVNATAALPVTGGVPFPRGRCARPMACACSPRMAGSFPCKPKRWRCGPGGSVKWLLLDFQAQPGRRDFVLQYGAEASTARAAQPLRATTSDRTLTVDTGPPAIHRPR